jgi:hypothetical protein
MCDCIEKVEEKLSEKMGEPCSLVECGLFSGKTFSIIEYKDTSYKKPKTCKVSVQHSYCPFCGNKYDD